MTSGRSIASGRPLLALSTVQSKWIKSVEVARRNRFSIRPKVRSQVRHSAMKVRGSGPGMDIWSRPTDGSPSLSKPNIWDAPKELEFPCGRSKVGLTIFASIAIERSKTKLPGSRGMTRRSAPPLSATGQSRRHHQERVPDAEMRYRAQSEWCSRACACRRPLWTTPRPPRRAPRLPPTILRECLSMMAAMSRHWPATFRYVTSPTHT
jgi:hypothetical protein